MVVLLWVGLCVCVEGWVSVQSGRLVVWRKEAPEDAAHPSAQPIEAAEAATAHMACTSTSCVVLVRGCGGRRCSFLNSFLFSRSC